MTLAAPRRGRAAAWRAAAALALVFALTGCLRLDFDLSVQEESVSGSMIAAVDQQTAQLFGMTPEDIFETPAEDDFSNLEGVTAEPYEDGDWIGVEYVFDSVALEDLNAAGEGDEEFPSIVYDAAAQQYEFTLTLDLTDFLTEDDEELGIPGFDPEAMREQFDVRVAITFPGEVIEHNGELSGTTVVWAPELGDVAEMQAVALASGGPGPEVGPGEVPGEPAAGPGTGPGTGSGGGTSSGTALVVALIALVVAGGGGLAAWLLLRRRGQAATPAAAGPSETGHSVTGHSETGGNETGGSGTGGGARNTPADPE